MAATKAAGQTPALCRMVIAAGVPHDGNNGSDQAPAVITRVWSDELVNVKVLTDGHRDLWWTSVPLYAGPDELDAAREAFLAEHDAGAVFHGVCWPAKA
jgi:hypothetical protein